MLVSNFCFLSYKHSAVNINDVGGRNQGHGNDDRLQTEVVVVSLL